LQLQEKKEKKEITIIIDTVGDESLQARDYIALPASSEDEENSSNSSSEKSEYSL